MITIIGIVVLAGMSFMLIRAAAAGTEATRRMQDGRVLLVVCSRCGRPQRVDAFTDETVGKWGERMMCSPCKAEHARSGDGGGACH